MLNCLHSFCKECLDKYYDEQGSGTNLKCPDCEISTPLTAVGRIDLLPKDLRVSYEADIATYELKVKSKKEIECDRCVDPENGPAVSFCCNECEFLCKVCTKDHKTWRKTLHHELINLSEKKKKGDVLKNIPHAPMTCNAHPDATLTYFCESHHILLCRDCVLLEHKSCEYQMIKSAAEAEKADLLSYLGKVEEIRAKLEDAMGHGDKVMQRVNATHKTVDDSIKNTFKALYEALRSRERALLSVSGDIALGKETALRMQHENLKKFHDDATNTCKRVKAATEVYTPAEMLSTKTTMVTKLQYLMKLFQETILEPCKSEVMPTSLDNAALLKDIQLFGQVIAGCCPSLSTATIEFIPKAVKCRERKFVIQARDSQDKPYPKGGEPVYATIRLMGSEESPTSLAVTDNENGTYSISFTPTSIGEHVLSVTISNEHIKRSPFIVYVREPRDYTALNASIQTFKATNVRGVALDEHSNLYVTLDNHSIVAFDKSGTQFSELGTPGSNSSDDGKFCYPKGILLKNDLMYVADESNHRIQKLKTSGELVAKFGTKGSEKGQLNGPSDICINPEGKIFVSESGNNRVSVFEADGTFCSHITGQGYEGGEMKSPRGIAIDTTGNLHVTNSGGNTVKIYSQGGEYISEYGSDKVTTASGICIDAEGYSFIGTNTNPGRVEVFNPFIGTNTNSGRVEVFDLEHKHIKTITGHAYTWHLALDNDGFLYAADYSNNRVQKY